MNTITFDEDVNLSKRHFRNLEELRMEMLLMEEQAGLSPEHIKILKEREREADNATDEGLSWEEVKANIRRKNA